MFELLVNLKQFNFVDLGLQMIYKWCICNTYELTEFNMK